MSDNATRHVSYEQVRSMLDFMGQHVDFATGSLRTLEARYTSKKLWGELAQTLNGCRGGTRKTMDGWSKYWSDFKNKLKNKVRILNKRKRLGSTEKGMRPLTKLEKRALVILGPYFQRKICQVNVAGCRQDRAELPQVKIEDEPEQLEKQSGQSDKSLEQQSEDEADSDFDDDSENNSNETLIDTLYPKWLIEVEKKRAEAELARAKAEEARARVAAQAARAATTQAEALRSLARAAAAQAEAVARIAAALERAPAQSLLNI